jgi:hypothetical protein
MRVDGVEGGARGEGEGVRADTYDGAVGEVGLVVAEVTGSAVCVVGWQGKVLEDASSIIKGEWEEMWIPKSGKSGISSPK